MSLINKMLQDLDARGGAARPAASSDVRPVAAERTSRTAIAVGAGIGALIVVGAGAWYYLHRAPAAPAAVAAVAVVPAVPSRVAPAPVAPLPEPVVPDAPAEAAVPEEPAVPVPAGQAVSTESPLPVTAKAAPSPEAAIPRVPANAAQAGAEGARPRAVKPPRLVRDAAATAAAVTAPERPAAQGTALTSRQQGENAYRRALAALQEGRVTDGVAALELAVHAYPRHEAARQTLVGLLIENGQIDGAMRHAQLGLGLDANQPQLAMVLARLQLERGGPAAETLQRSLPHAATNADYLAFLAGVLQRQGRHREAAEQYEAALRLRPGNGVWWMGLGISQQAENLRTNAREAFQKARDSGLSPELQAFVERRLGQLN